MNTAYKIIILIILSAFQNVFAVDSFLRFAIDKDAYQQFNDSQRNKLNLKIQELDSFVTQKIIEKIPKDISDKLTDLKIKVSFSNLPGRDGLFTPDISGEQTITLQLTQLSSNGINALLAHEIYHAIHFHLNPNELPWVREGMAQLFEFLATNELNGKNLSAAIKNPMTPLLGEYSIEEKNPAQYGHNMLYFYYLYNHCGKDKLFWSITEAKNQNGQKGSFLIDGILKEINISAAECEDFSSSAITFEVAKLHNQIQFLNLKEKNKFSVAPMEIAPSFITPKSENELANYIKGMPVISSYKIALADFKKLKGSCSNCEIFYASKDFPYTVSESEPQKTKDIDVILVKTLQK
jgi:hypothetical protein